MKLEVGKYYKASNGTKYKCVHDFENKHNAHLGRFLCATDGYNGGTFWRFHANGENDNTYCGINLISEWVEPKEFTFEVAVIESINIDGKEIYFLQDVDNLTPDGIKAIVAKRTITLTEGEGL